MSLLMEVLASLAERIERGEPDGFLAPDRTGLSRVDRLEYVAGRWGPWLVEQHASFWNAHSQGRLSVLFIRKEDIERDPTRAAHEILSHAGRPERPILEAPNAEELARASATVSAGGPETVDLEGVNTLRGHLQVMTQGFNGVDFSPLGLDFAQGRRGPTLREDPGIERSPPASTGPSC